MKSLDMLREEIRTLVDNHIDTDELVRIADAIEREVEEKYVELPKDANGEYIHVGDRLVGKYLAGNQIVECTRLTFANGWTVGYGRDSGTPHCFTHYKPPTVEDVLTDMYRKLYEATRARWASECTIGEYDEKTKAIIAECAQKLRLANNEE